MPRGRKPKIEVASNPYLRSRLDPRNFGITPKSDEDVRWVSDKRIEERKSQGYTFVKPADGQPTNAEGNIKFPGVVLMTRPKQLAEESRKRKEAETRYKSQQVRESIHHDVERLSSQHGIDLHKYVESERDEN